MTGIISAMSKEAEYLLGKTKYKKTARISGIDFVTGKLFGKDVVIAVCGVGKVNAAVCTQAMIMKYSPEFIINTGVAGSLTTRLHCGDIAIGSSVIQHDFDGTAFGELKGRIPGIGKINFECDRAVVARLKAICEAEGFKCRSGVIATGDVFIADKKKAQGIVNWFGALACDMESGAIGQTCYLNGTPFIVLRAMSDEADGSATVSFDEFMPLAAERAAKMIEKLFETEE